MKAKAGRCAACLTAPGRGSQPLSGSEKAMDAANDEQRSTARVRRAKQRYRAAARAFLAGAAAARRFDEAQQELDAAPAEQPMKRANSRA
jgi:hypothetical protein